MTLHNLRYLTATILIAMLSVMRVILKSEVTKSIATVTHNVVQTKCSQAIDSINPGSGMVRACYSTSPIGYDIAAIILIATLGARWRHCKVGDITIVSAVNIETIKEIQVVTPSFLV